MTVNDMIPFSVSKEVILLAIRQAIRQEDFLDNLRNRDPIVRLDSRIRGYIGELCIRGYLNKNGITVEPHTAPRPNTCDVDIAVRTASGILQGEIKTSNLPAFAPSLEHVVSHCDIKIIRRETRHTDIDRDFYIQIYYTFPTQTRDAYLKQLYRENNNHIPRNAEEIYTLYHYEVYQDHTYFAAWNDKHTIESALSAMPASERTYQFGKRTFWTCKIRQSRTPASIVQYFKNL